MDVELSSPARGQALVRTMFSGISPGSEMLAYRGEIDPELPLDDTLGALAGTFRWPFRFGYSCVGTVDDSRGEIEEGTQVFAFQPHQDLFVQPVESLTVVDDVDARLATLFPLVETALQFTLDLGVGEGKLVVVTGLGAVGMLTALMLRRSGARPICSEPLGWRRDLAAELGIAAVAPSELERSVMEATDGHGAPASVEVSGDPSALAQLLSLLAHEGVALVGSWYGTRIAALPLGGAFHRRRLSIQSSQVSSIPALLTPEWTIERRRRAVAEILNELPLASLATHEWPFEEASSAFAALDRGVQGLVHAALQY